MDTFSSTDDGTNAEFAVLNDGITISAIVNVDPDFRLTLYTVEIDPLRYSKTRYETDDSKIPDEIRVIAFYKDIEKQINDLTRMENNPIRKLFQRRGKKSFRELIENQLTKSEKYKGKHIELLMNDESDREFLIDNYIVDEILFCEDNGIPYIFDSSGENKVKLTIGKDDPDLKFSFYMAIIPDEEENGKQPMFTYQGRLYPYKGNLLKTAWEEYSK